MADNNNKLKFLRGTSAELAALDPTKIVDGAFYLTTDNHKLFYGQEQALQQLNNSIKVVAKTENLPSKLTQADAASFYYVEDGRIFAFWNGNTWEQINPDTDTNDYLNAVAYTLTAGTDAENKVNITWQGTRSDNEKLGDTYTIQGGTYTKVTKVADKTVKIEGTGYGIETEQVYNATEPAVAENEVKINLTNTNNLPKDSISIAGGKNIKVSSASDKITIDLDGSLGLTSVSTGALAEGFSVTVTDADNNPVSTTNETKLNPIIQLGADSTDPTKQIKFKNNVAVLDVYTKAELDTKFNALDSMRYRGVFSSTNKISDFKDVEAGDTYRAGADLTIEANGIKATKGDLLIANKDKASTTADWDVIEVEIDVEDSRYKGVAINNGLAIQGVGGNDDGANIGAITISAGAGIAVEDSWEAPTEGEEEEEVNSNIITVKHADTSTYASPEIQTDAEQDEVQSLTFKVIKKVSVDAFGHITGIDTADIKVVDTNTTVESITHTVSATNNVATVATAMSVKSGDGTAQTVTGSSFAIGTTSTNLTITEPLDNNQIQLELVWGNFS